MTNERLMRELVKGSVVTLIGIDGQQIPYEIHRVLETGCLKDFRLGKRELRQVIAEYQIDDLRPEFRTPAHDLARFDEYGPRMRLWLIASGNAHAAWASPSGKTVQHFNLRECRHEIGRISYEVK